MKDILKPEKAGVSRTEKTIALTLASMVNTFLNLALSMMATRFLVKTEIAINSQTFLVYTTLLPFLTLGITSGIYYYLSKNENRRKTVVVESVLVTIITSVIFSVFILLGGNSLLASSFKNDFLKYTLYWIIPYAILNTPASVLSCVLVYEDRLKFNAFFTVAHTFFTLLFTFIAMVIFRTGLSMIIARVVVGCIFAVLIGVIVFKIVPDDNGKVEWRSIYGLVAVSIPLGIASIVGTLSSSLDKWIISMMLAPEIYAVYVQGARELPLISTVTGSINTVVLVDLTKAAKEKRYNDAVNLFRSVAEKTSMLLMPIMVFCLASAKPLITFLYTSSYEAAIPVFQVYLLYMPIRVVYYGPFLIALGKSKFVMFKTLCGLVVNAVLSVIMVKLMGAIGAALATILSVYFFNVPMNLYAISKETQAKWIELLPFKSILKAIFLSLPGALIVFLFNKFIHINLYSLLQLAINFVLFIAVTMPLFIWKYSINIKTISIKILNRFKSKKCKKD